MSHIVTMLTADQDRALSFLQGREPAPDQQRTIGIMRREARDHQDDLDRQGVDWGLTVPEALEHLLAGRADSEAEYAGHAYYSALRHVISCTGSDPGDFGVYSRPATFFGLMDDELRRLGIPAEFLPGGFLYAGPPEGIAFPVPRPVDGYPAIGRLPLALAAPLADAYEAVLGRVHEDFADEAARIAETMRFEHEQWQTALRYGYTMDTLFFFTTG